MASEFVSCSCLHVGISFRDAVLLFQIACVASALWLYVHRALMLVQSQTAFEVLLVCTHSICFYKTNLCYLSAKHVVVLCDADLTPSEKLMGVSKPALHPKLIFPVSQHTCPTVSVSSTPRSAVCVVT